MSITRKKLLKKKDIVQNSKFSSENRNPMVFPTSGKFYCNTSVGYAGFQTRTPAYTPHFRGTRKDFQAKKFILLRKQSQLAPSPEDPGKLIWLLAGHFVPARYHSPSAWRFPTPLHPLSVPGLNCPSSSKAHLLIHLRCPLPHALSSPVFQPPQAQWIVDGFPLVYNNLYTCSSLSAVNPKPSQSCCLPRSRLLS